MWIINISHVVKTFIWNSLLFRLFIGDFRDILYVSRLCQIFIEKTYFFLYRRKRKTHRNYTRPHIDSSKINVPLCRRDERAAKRSIENSRANALRDWNFKGTQFRRNDVYGGSYALVRTPRIIGFAIHDVTRRTRDFSVSICQPGLSLTKKISSEKMQVIYFKFNND